MASEMEKGTYQDRLDLFRQKLRETGADTAWIVQPENRRYLSGFKAEDPQLTESSGSLFISASRMVLVTDSRYAEQAKDEAALAEVHTVKGDLMEELPGLLEDLGTKTLGFEGHYLTWSRYNRLSKKIETLNLGIKLIPLEELVESLREIKSGDEIRLMEDSATMISSILDEVIPWIKPGMTEKKVKWHIEDMARNMGADDMAFPPIVASGPNAALPHAVPTDRKIREGEPIILDVGVKLAGYCSDTTRTVFLGDPEEEFKTIYDTVRSAQLAALEIIKDGVKSDEPDKVARNIIKKAGYGEYFGHALGHGVGLATHEGPRLSSQKPVLLRRGMVVTVEPGIYIPEKGGVRLEEMVLVEPEGAKILTKNRYFYKFFS